MPLFLLTIYAKNRKADLTKSECNQLAKLAKHIVNNYDDRHV